MPIANKKLELIKILNECDLKNAEIERKTNQLNGKIEFDFSFNPLLVI